MWTRPASDAANPDGLAQAGERVLPERDEFLPDVSLVAGVRDRPHDGRVVQLLTVVDFIPPRAATRMIVGEMPVIFPNGPDHIPLHDLHVVNVIEQAEVRAVQDLAESDAPGAVVALIVGMVHLAVEQFHAEREAEFLREGKQAAESDRAVLETFLFGKAVTISGKANHLFCPGRGGGSHVGLVDFDQRVMMFEAIECLFNATDFDAAGSFSNWETDHGAGQTVTREDGHVVRHDEIDR